MQFYSSGTRIADRYEVAGRPLVGGMGVVYLCFDHQEQRPVALKTFKPEFLPDRLARERFLEEGNTWVRLGKHPHIVRCYQVFQDSPRPEVYLVLELVAKEDGRRDASLRSWLTLGRPLPTDQALLITLQIARGMRHAAEIISGFVHRDLKPENVLVGADRLSNAPINRVRVTDFGLVRGLRVEQAPAAVDADLAQGLSRLTRIGSIVGTPQYMAPEQWEGSDVTMQADIYALGCILGEMLTGRMLVQGGMLDELQRAHQDGQTMRAVQSVPDAVRELLTGCLAVDPGRRHHDWAVVEAGLAAVYGQVADRLAPEVEAASTLNRAERVAVGWSYSHIGKSYLEIGNAPAGLACFERAREAGQVDRERRLEAVGLTHLGNTLLELDRSRWAIDYYEQALAIDREICTGIAKGSPEWMASRSDEGTDLGNLGNAYRQLGKVREARGYYEQALVIFREICTAFTVRSQEWTVSRHGEGLVLSNLGLTCADLGEMQRAIDYYKQALSIRREVGDRRGIGDDLGNLASVYLYLGDLWQAIGYYEQSLAIRCEIGDRIGEGNDLGNLGTVYRQLGKIEQAIGYYERALIIDREVGDLRGEGTDLNNLGITYAMLGDAQQAIRYYEQALTIRLEIGDANGVAHTSFNTALLRSQQGNEAVALPLAREAARLWSQMGHIAYAHRAQQLVVELERQGG